MKRSREDGYLTTKVLFDNFHIQLADMRSHGVPETRDKAGRIVHHLDDVVQHMGHVLLQRLSDKYEYEARENPASIVELKRRKLAAELHKLELVNAQTEKSLVSAASVYNVFAKGVKAIADVLDGIPSQMRMENPDLPQSAIDGVNRTLIRVRNEAAEIVLEIEE